MMLIKQKARKRVPFVCPKMLLQTALAYVSIKTKEVFSTINGR